MSKIEINNVYKIFGPKPSDVLQMVKNGASKEEVLDKTVTIRRLGSEKQEIISRDKFIKNMIQENKLPLN